MNVKIDQFSLIEQSMMLIYQYILFDIYTVNLGDSCVSLTIIFL